MSRRSRVPATLAKTSYQVPVCSACKTSENVQRDPTGRWVCIKCADDWLNEYAESRLRGKSMGGVVLPSGVSDKRRQTKSFKEVFPNRRARRAAK